MKTEEIVALIKTSPLFETKEERQEWIEVILPKLEGEKLDTLVESLQKAEAEKEKMQQERIKFLEERNQKAREAIKKAKVIIRKGKEKEAQRSEKEDMVSLEKELEGIS